MHFIHYLQSYFKHFIHLITSTCTVNSRRVIVLSPSPRVLSKIVSFQCSIANFFVLMCNLFIYLKFTWPDLGDRTVAKDTHAIQQPPRTGPPFSPQGSGPVACLFYILVLQLYAGLLQNFFFSLNSYSMISGE